MGDRSSRVALIFIIGSNELPVVHARFGPHAPSCPWHAKPWAILHGPIRGDELDLEDQRIALRIIRVSNRSNRVVRFLLIILAKPLRSACQALSSSGAGPV